MPDFVIVGAGLFGSTIAKTLHDAGASVLVVDDRREGAGSRPAACLMKPSWFSSLGRDVYDPALRQLEETWGVHDLQFRAGVQYWLNAPVTVHWCDPAEILGWPEAAGVLVSEIATAVEGRFVKFARGSERQPGLEARVAVVVATGAWTGQLVQLPGLTAQAGVSCWWRGQLPYNFIRPWAPYRQVVAFNIDEERIWAGDGTAILSRNWTPERRLQSVERCRRAVTVGAGPVEVCFGLRPYVRGAKPAHLEERQPGLWIATGGAKNGTLAAGWCAHTLKRRLL